MVQSGKVIRPLELRNFRDRNLALCRNRREVVKATL